jgi:alkylation response protein AidB-like acyl-CoA dehydrogenase
MDRGLYAAEHLAFRETVRKYVDIEVAPNLAAWDAQRVVDRTAWLAAGKQGVIGLSGPEAYGGGGQSDYRFRNIVMEELARVGAASVSSSFALQDDILIPYISALGSAEQLDRWMPGMCDGSVIAAVAMTEPGAGSDLQGIRTTATPTDGGWRLSGAKTFITSGIQSEIVVVVARTDSSAGSKGFTLLVAEEGMPGFSRGRKLDKIGLPAQDTAELFFADVFIPEGNVLGPVGGAMPALMRHLPLERLSIAAAAIAAADAAFAWTIEYVQERRAFGQPVADFQNTRFVLAEVATELDVTRAFVDKAVLAHGEGALTAVDAAKAKLWATEVQGRVIDRLLQMHGGYGYMVEYPIARAFQDARVQRIFGGTSEIMKMIIGRDLIGRR